MHLKKLQLSLRNRQKNGTPSSTQNSSVKSTSALAPRLLPGDQPTALSPGQKVSPSEVRELNDLIRKRYALDIDIWNKRRCRPRDRRHVQDKMLRADAVLDKISATVALWDNPAVWESTADWHRLKRIKQKLEEGGQRIWMNNPPWEAS
jgi:hypothetical protein